MLNLDPNDTLAQLENRSKVKAKIAQQNEAERQNDNTTVKIAETDSNLRHQSLTNLPANVIARISRKLDI